MGKRGMHHATAFNSNPEIPGDWDRDIDQKRLDDAAPKLGNPAKGTDAAALAKQLKPDVFVSARCRTCARQFIQAAGGAKLVAFENRIALTSQELFAIRDLLAKVASRPSSAISTVYGKHYQKVKEIVAKRRALAACIRYGTATALMTHYAVAHDRLPCWYNDYLAGVWRWRSRGKFKFAGQSSQPGLHRRFRLVRQWRARIYECGAGAPDQPEVAKWWARTASARKARRVSPRC